MADTPFHIQGDEVLASLYGKIVLTQIIWFQTSYSLMGDETTRRS